MTRIGLLSDTHSFLDDKVFTHFEHVDEIWHAGDFGVGVDDRLAGFKPLRGVYGNIDGQDIRLSFPETLRFRVEECDVIMQHIGGYPGRYAPGVRTVLQAEHPKLFISGHSHILKAIPDKALGLLHLNPGAAGKHGWHKVRTLMRFSISGARIHDLEVIELAGR
ncbi:MAG: metallophosphoesterase family protein [Mucilaginibacter polytrichastri]|nr:metallophosphoesterase family protein [Mucilaginibacter polytrichastri]